MKQKNIDQIKSLESPPKIVNIFSEKEIKMMQELYAILPEKIFNKKQNVRKKSWITNYNKELDKIYFNKIKDVLGDYKMDNLKSETGEDYYGLFHESFSPLPIHVDSGFDAEDIIYKQVITPLTPIGDTIFFKKRWYGRSTTFTNNPEDLKFKPKSDQNDRSNEHLGNKEFDKELYKKYLTHTQNHEKMCVKILKTIKITAFLIHATELVHGYKTYFFVKNTCYTFHGCQRRDGFSS